MLTIQGCVTTTKVDYTLPPKPQRTEQKKPETIKDYGKLVAYYEYLVQLWEQWGEDVTGIIEKENKK